MTRFHVPVATNVFGDARDLNGEIDIALVQRYQQLKDGLLVGLNRSTFLLAFIAKAQGIKRRAAQKLQRRQAA